MKTLKNSDGVAIIPLEDEEMHDMVNLYFRSTGINCRICISSKEPRQIPRIKVYYNNNSEHIALSIEDCPKIVSGTSSIISSQILSKAKEWILLNKELLLYYWEHSEMDAVELVEKVRKI